MEEETLKTSEENSEHALLEARNTTNAIKELEPILDNVLLTVNKTAENTKQLVNDTQQIVENTKPKDIQKISLEGIEVITLKGEKGEKGDKGDKHTGEELTTLIKTLIPEPIKGDEGVDGTDGKDGYEGADGKDGVNGIDGTDGEDGVSGKDGKDGANGASDTGEDIKKKLETLEKGKRLSYDLLDDLPNLAMLRGRSASSKTTSITELQGVSITTPSNDQVLKYNSATGQWENGTGGGGGSQTLAQTLTLGNTTGANNIVVTTGQYIKSSTGQTRVDLAGGAFIVTTDDGGFNTPFAVVDTSGVYLGSFSNSAINMDINGIEVSSDLLKISAVTPTQFDALTATTVPYIDASKQIKSSTVTPTELGYVSGVTSAIQTQISGLVPYTGATGNVDLGSFKLTTIIVETPLVYSFDGTAGADGDNLSLYAGGADNGIGNSGGRLDFGGGRFAINDGGGTGLRGGHGVAVNASGGHLTLSGGEAIGTGVGGDVNIVPGYSPGGNGKILLHNRLNNIAELDVSLITTTDKTFTFPNTTGTLALTNATTFSSLVSIGTITTGVWNGSTINQAYLGSGGGGSTKFLREDNTWQTVAGGGSGITRSISSISTPTTAGATAATDYVFKCTATLTLTLPTAVGNQNLYTVKVTAGTTTVACNGAQTIDGSSTAVLSVANTSLTLISDNANWLVV